MLPLELAKYACTVNTISPGAATRLTIPLVEGPAVIRAFRAESLWTQHDLDAVMPALLDARRRHDERIKKEATPEPLK